MAGIEDNRTKPAGVWGDLLSLSVYKRNQGRTTRQATFAALALVLGIGTWRLAQLIPLWLGPGAGMTVGGTAPATEYGLRFLVPALLLAAGLWIAYRAVNVPRFADFLIAVEAEMAKVSWPSGDEVARSSVVIIFLIFALAAILAGYDLFWMFVLRYVLRIT